MMRLVDMIFLGASIWLTVPTVALCSLAVSDYSELYSFRLLFD